MILSCNLFLAQNRSLLALEYFPRVFDRKGRALASGGPLAHPDELCHVPRPAEERALS
jgi:hypothetical protein